MIQRGIILILMGVSIVAVGTLGRHIDRIHNRASSLINHRRATADSVGRGLADDVTTSGSTCSACSGVEDDLNAEERRKLMIELAKIKLLKKLNLTEAPSFAAGYVKPLPAPILTTINREMQKDEPRTSKRHKSDEDLGVSVEKVVLVGEEGRNRFHFINGHSFHFVYFYLVHHIHNCYSGTEPEDIT